MSNVKRVSISGGHFKPFQKVVQCSVFRVLILKMEFRLRASPEQFTIMLDFMERNGDLSRPLPGAQGRLRAEQHWNELTELLNSVGGSGVQKHADKWKRVWSDWKTKTKKKAAQINRDTQGTGGGPSRTRPLNSLEERVLRIIGLRAIMGHQEIQEAGFEVQLLPEPIARTPSPSQPTQASPPPAVQEASTSQREELPHTPEPQPLSNTGTLNVASNSRRRYEDVIRSPSAGPSTPRRRRVAGQRRRRYQTPFEEAASEFVRVENGRLRLEEMRILKEHEREMEQLRVESLRIAMEESRNNILQRIADIATNVMELLSRQSLAETNSIRL